MDNSYIFPIEGSIRNTVFQFKNALKTDRVDLERYKASNHSNANIVDKWDRKLTTYMDAYNDLELLLNRAITIDHERSTYIHQINKLKADIKRLNAYLNILSVTKTIEIEEQVKYKTEQQINRLCKQAQAEVQQELALLCQNLDLQNIYSERRDVTCQ